MTSCREVREVLLSIPGVVDAVVVDDSAHMHRGILSITLFVLRGVQLADLGLDDVLTNHRIDWAVTIYHEDGEAE